jgi:hypothetical protein
MQQPSAQGIAALFRGNPQPLQQRIEQEQQGKPGLPPDLQKLLALNIITNEKDAVAKQQAMDQLAQMQGQQGQQGQMPTVMQTVQEQARQKMQAQQVQAQQQQQGLQALMEQSQSPQVPEDTPQPEAQPQGIDELPVDFQMAGGGIVAFKKGGDEGEYETPYDRMNRENRERSEAEEKSRLENIRAMGNETMPYAEQMRNLGQAIDRAVPDPIMLLRKLVGDPSLDRAEAKSTKAAESKTAADNRSALNASEARMQSIPPAPRPIADLKALAEQQRQQQEPRPLPVARPPQAAPSAPSAPMVAPQAATLPQESEADLIQKAAMRRDPEAERIASMERRREAIGAPDTSAQDRMIAELEKRKAQLEGPQDGFGRLMEYLGQVAATPRGLSSFEAGAQGASGVRKLEQARQLEQYDLTKQALDVSQKKLDTVRAFATDQYNVGENRFNQVFKEQFDAAKQVSNNEQEARKLAQQNTLKMFELEQNAKLDRERMQNQLKVANIGQTREYNEQNRINQITSLKQQARRATDPKVATELMARATDLEMAIGRGRWAGGSGSAVAGDRQELAELKTLLKSAEDTASNFMLPAKTREDAVRKMSEINRQIASMTKMGPSVAEPLSAGKVPPPPPGFKMN